MAPHTRIPLVRPLVLQGHVATEALVQGTMRLKARSLVPLGAGPLAGLTARPYFTRRHDMLQQLQALATYDIAPGLSWLYVSAGHAVLSMPL